MALIFGAPNGLLTSFIYAPGREELDVVVRDTRAICSLFCHSNWSCVDWWLWLQGEKLLT